MFHDRPIARVSVRTRVVFLTRQEWQWSHLPLSMLTGHQFISVVWEFPHFIMSWESHRNAHSSDFEQGMSHTSLDERMFFVRDRARGSFIFLCPSIFPKYLKSIRLHIITAREYDFQEAERQCFGSISLFQRFVLCSREIYQISCFLGLEVYPFNGPHRRLKKKPYRWLNPLFHWHFATAIIVSHSLLC